MSEAEPVRSLFVNLFFAPEEYVFGSSDIDPCIEAKTVVDGDEFAANLLCFAERRRWGNAVCLLTDGTIMPLDLTVRLWVITMCVHGFEP